MENPDKVWIDGLPEYKPASQMNKVAEPIAMHDPDFPIAGGFPGGPVPENRWKPALEDKYASLPADSEPVEETVHREMDRIDRIIVGEKVPSVSVPPHARDDAPKILQFFSYSHLPPKLQQVSYCFSELAKTMVDMLPANDERELGLRHLLYAKDCFVRAAIYKG